MATDNFAIAATAGSFSEDPPTPRLPVEVCARIIDHVATEVNFGYMILTGEPHLFTLASCALVCTDWYYLTWYHLRQSIYLRDRKAVVSLSKTLHARPRLRDVVRQVTISGASPRERQLVHHLGTFVAMLAGKAPKLSRITIRNADWSISSVQMKHLSFLAAFRAVHTLYIAHVTVSSVAQLSHLVSALPGLRDLRFVIIDCLQKPKASPVPIPLNCTNLEVLEVLWVAPAVEDLFLGISQASRARYLLLGLDGEAHQSSTVSRSQTLLDASAASVEKLRLYFRPNSPVRIGTIEAVERHYNLAHHKGLWILEIRLYHPFVAWSWIPHIVSCITSKQIQAVSVVAMLRTGHMADDLDGILMTLEGNKMLMQLDSTLQEPHFATIAPRGICLGFDYHDNTWHSDTELFRTGSTLQEPHDRWNKFVTRMMRESDRRGILTTVNNAQGIVDWRMDMQRIHGETVARAKHGEQQEQATEGGEHRSPGGTV